jgi:predicted PurR-regulated permease PerM
VTTRRLSDGSRERASAGWIAQLSPPLWVLAVVASAFFLRETRQIFVPLALALLASYAVFPLFAALNRLQMPPIASAAVVVGGLVALGGWAGYSLRDDVTRTARELPEQIRQVRARLLVDDGSLLSRVRDAGRALDDPTPESASPAADEPPETPASDAPLAGYLWQGSLGLAALAGQTTVFVFFLFFFLVGASEWRGRLIALAGDMLSSRRTGADVLDEINEQVRRFLLVRLLTTGVVGVATWLALVWLGAPAPALWAVSAGLLNWIPYFGPLIVSVGLALVGVMSGGLPLAAQLAGATLAITSLEGWLITPALLGRAAQMNTLAVLTSLMFWSWVWGVWGTILAVPLTTVIKALSDHIERLSWLSLLLGNQPARTGQK